MAVDDIFTTRAIMRAVQRMDPPSQFLLDLFFTGTPNTFASDVVQIDIEKRQQKLAPFVNPLAAAKAEPRAGYSTDLYRPPTVKPMRSSSAADFLRRAPGVSQYDDLTIGEQAADLMQRDLDEMDREIARREEWMAGQILTTGKVHVAGEGVDDEIDFQWTASHLIASTSLAGGAGWNGGSANPITDLQTAIALVLESGHNATEAVFGALAWADFIGNEDVQAYMNILRINPGEVLPQKGQIGGRKMGAVLGVNLWLYNEFYADANGTVTAMIPTDSVIIGSTDSRAERNYGAIPDVECLIKTRRYAKSWVEPNPSIRYVLMQSSPLPMAHEPDAFVSLNTRA